MQNFIKTIISSIQNWTNKQIKKQIKGSTADWNQNDSTADSYVKNRTHWEETKEAVLVDNLTFDKYDNGNAPQCNFVPNQVYTVVWNGKKYENLVCYFNGEYNIIADSNLGCPFYIDDDGGDALYIESYDDNTDWTVSIFTTQSVVHKLDSKYLNLPTNLATTDDVQGALDAAETAQTTADGKMNKNNPVGTGSFSINRKAGTTVGNYSHAEGSDTTASGNYSHAEGYDTTASGDYSHAEGRMNIASGRGAHAEGCSLAGGFYSKNVASGDSSHAEGIATTASGSASHTEGFFTIATGGSQHVQGQYNIADSNNTYAHIVGNGNNFGTNTVRSNAHTLDWDGNAWYSGDVYVGSISGTDKDDGSKKLATEEYVDSKVSSIEAQQAFTSGANVGSLKTNYAQPESDDYAMGLYAIATGLRSKASGDFSYAEGYETHAEGDGAHAEGRGEQAPIIISGAANATTYSDVRGDYELDGIEKGTYITYNDITAIVLSYNNRASTFTVDKTLSTTALTSATAYLRSGIASGNYSHSEGSKTIASGQSSHAEGSGSVAAGTGSHAEGGLSYATGYGSHAEGQATYAEGTGAHAEGVSSKAIGTSAHASGYGSVAIGNGSHADGYSTIATTRTNYMGHQQHASGRFNIPDVRMDANGNWLDSNGNITADITQAEPLETYAYIFGNGAGSTSRSNSHTLDWDGNAWFAGDVYVKSTSGTNKDAGSKKLATEQYVQNSLTSESWIFTLEDGTTITKEVCIK